MAKNTFKPVVPATVELLEEVISDELVEDDLTAEEVLDEPVVVVEPILAPKSTDSYFAVDGDSYASIAAKFNKGSVSNFQYAKRLLDLNGGKSIASGTEVRLG